MVKRHCKGQSTLEYVILVTSVIVVIIWLLMGSNSPFRTRLNSTFETGLNKVGDVTSAWDRSIGQEAQ